MNVTCLLEEFECGALFIHIEDIDEEKAISLGSFLEDNGFEAWTKDPMDEYIITRFIEDDFKDDDFRYLFCDVGGKNDVSVASDLKRIGVDVIELDDFMKIAAGEETDYDSSFDTEFNAIFA